MILGQQYQTSVSRDRALVRNGGLSIGQARGASFPGVVIGWPMAPAPARPGCVGGIRGRCRRVARSCQAAAMQAAADTQERPRQAMIPGPRHRFHRTLRLHWIGGWQRRRRSNPADYKLERTRRETARVHWRHGCTEAARSGGSPRNPNNRSSALNLSNGPNRLPRGLLQQALGGEHHETCFCTRWSRRA
jgi:hypothetical protein